MNTLRFEPRLLTKSNTRGIDVETSLVHFAIITLLVEPADLRQHIPDRFQLDCITTDSGAQKALVSVVPFLDVDFHFAKFPWVKFRFGQTNYRAYVTDTVTGKHVVWFFGTSLASIINAVPRYIWKLPWHKAQISFDCDYDVENGRYAHYQMTTTSHWAPAELNIQDSGQPPRSLLGFPSLEAGLVLLTHPLRGYYYRRDGRLGHYTIWHDRLQTTLGSCVKARFPLLERLGLLDEGDLGAVHSVLLQHRTDFTIYLPPKSEKH